MKQDLFEIAERQFPEYFPILREVTMRVTAALPGSDLDSLSRRSPGLKGFDWAVYLRASMLRLGHVLQHLPDGDETQSGRVLEYGSYFGNFAIGARLAGYHVTAVDSYRSYDNALAKWQSLMQGYGIETLEFDDTGYGLDTLPAGHFDAILCLGVIEHVPHTPRITLEALDRVLKPGGRLILDTPNLAYLYKRRTLNEGQSVYASLESQYYTELPFEGHHREYTKDEIEWMLQQIGHEVIAWDFFNYSVPALPELDQQLLEDVKLMDTDELLREIILSVSVKR